MHVVSRRMNSIALIAAVGLAGFSMTGKAEKIAMNESGVVKVRSSYQMNDTITRLRNDIAGKGITFFGEIDQAALAAKDGVALRPSTLLVFGNPALGSQFVTSNPSAGLDWPVRLLVRQDESGAVWAEYTDFQWIARRHAIKNRPAAFAKASEVIASITSSIAAK